MKTSSRRIAMVVAGTLSALALAFPARSYADHDWDSPGWQRVWYEGEELDQARNAQRSDWQRLQHEQGEMNEALQSGDWRRYQHERREAENAANALARDRGWAEHEQRELTAQQWAYRHHHHHHHHDWD